MDASLHGCHSQINLLWICNPILEWQSLVQLDHTETVDDWVVAAALRRFLLSAQSSKRFLLSVDVPVFTACCHQFDWMQCFPSDPC